MDLSRTKKVLAGVSAAVITLSSVGSVLAAYSDVPAGVWYGDAVKAFTDAGYLDANQTKFRGGDNATRAEFVKLIVELNGGVLSTPPAKATFDDVSASSWYYNYMEEAAKEDWVKGDNSCKGTHPCYARPTANINRAEAAALITRAFALDATGDAPQFTDNVSGQWYTDAIQAAADHCVLQGDDSTGRVRPSDNMNRAEMVVMLHRVDQSLTYGVDCTSGGTTTPVTPSVKSATATSVTTVDVEFTVKVDQTTGEDITNYVVTGPNNTTMKVTAAKQTEDKVVTLTVDGSFDSASTYTVAVSNVLSDTGDKISDTATFKGYNATPIGNGNLEVAISSSNPVADSVPKGAVGVTMLSLDLKASCDDDVTLNNLTVLHEGFGRSADIAGIYVAQDGARLSRNRSITNQDQTAQLRFVRPLTIKKCGSTTIDLVTDFSTTATVSAEHDLAVELPSDVDSNAKAVTGNFPLRGNTFKIAAVDTGLVTVSYRTVSPSNDQVGNKAVALGRFEISSNSLTGSTAQDQTLYSITLEQNGSVADGDLSNLKVVRSDNTTVSNVVPTTTGKYATFVFDPPLTIKQGDRITLSVVGDITGGAAKNSNLVFEENSDLFAVGSLYGYGINGQLYGSQVSVSGTAGTVTIDAGQFTLSINGPVQQTYTRDTSNAIFANITADTGGADAVDIRKLYIAVVGQNSSSKNFGATGDTYTTTSIGDQIQNVKLRNTTTGETVSAATSDAGVGPGTSNTTYSYQIYRFDDLIVQTTSTWEFRADFKNNGSTQHPASGDQYKIVICGEPTMLSNTTNSTGCDFGGVLASASTSYQMQIEGLSTGDKVQDVRPRGNIAGNFMRVATAALTVAAKSLGTSDRAVKNSKNVNLFRFEARAGEAKDVLFTNAIFQSASGSLNNAQNYTLWVDTDSDGKVDTVVQSGVAATAGTTPTITFAKIKNGGFVIPKEQTVVFEVHGDIASSLTGDDIQLNFYTAGTYIEAEQLDTGSSLSGIITNGVGTGDITVTTAAGKDYVLVPSGNLYVSKDTVTERNHQCLGGELCDPALRLQFHAENEDIDVTNLQINSSGSTASTVDRLELYKDNASTPFATATVGACGSDDVQTTTLLVNPSGGVSTAYCASMQSRQLIIQNGKDVKVLVRPRLKNDVDGATPGNRLLFFIDQTASANNTTGSGAVRARGDQSSNNLGANTTTVANGTVFLGQTSAGSLNATMVGGANVSVLSKITSITNASPDANNTTVPNSVSPIAQFKIAAAAHTNSQNGLNKVTLSGVIFNVNATNVLIGTGSFKLYNKLNSSSTAKVACKTMTLAGVDTNSVNVYGNFLVQCDNLVTGTANTAIDQGSDATFVLEANVTSTKMTSNTTSTLQVTLQNFDSLNNTTFGPTTSHFQWVDKDNATATTGTFNWVEYPDTTVKSTSYQS